jgi:hypothetical protein
VAGSGGVVAGSGMVTVFVTANALSTPDGDTDAICARYATPARAPLNVTWKVVADKFTDPIDGVVNTRYDAIGLGDDAGGAKLTRSCPLPT